MADTREAWGVASLLQRTARGVLIDAHAVMVLLPSEDFLAVEEDLQAVDAARPQLDELARLVKSSYGLLFTFLSRLLKRGFANGSLAVAGILGHLWFGKPVEWRSYFLGTSKNPENRVIPA